jgi:DNA-binding NtrC family response regulator
MPDAAARVLLVDDEPALLRMMSLYLSRLGFAVTTSATTEQAWEEFQKAPAEIAIAILDATMAGLAMEDLALQMLLANPATRVIVSSGYPVNMADLEAAAPGRVAFLHKPYVGETLAALVRRMLGPQEESV